MAVLLGFGAGLAVAAALPPGPTVDVEVVPLAYGGDPAAGISPNLFGLGVRRVDCSDGATAYTLAVKGVTYRQSCANSSGTVTVGLSPGQSYTVTITPVQTRAGRSARLGSARTLTVHIPDADAKNWQAGP